MIRTGKWKVTSTTKHSHLYGKVWPYRDTTVNVMAYTQSCLLDDYMTFNTIYKAQRHYGTYTCLPGDPDLTDVNWGLSNDGNNMYIYGKVNDWFYPVDTMDLLHNNINLNTVNATISYFSPTSFILTYQAYFPTDTIYMNAIHAGIQAPDLMATYIDTVTYTRTFVQF